VESKLQQRRRELGLTLEEVGNIVGVSKSTVKKWESGYIKNMKRDKIALLAKALRVSPLYIMDTTCDFAIFNGDETIDMILYKNIKKKRLELGMSQEELAKKVGYSSRSMIAKIEAGDIDLYQSKIEEIAIALETTSAELMGWKKNTAEEIAIIMQTEADVGILIKDYLSITSESKKRLLAYAEKLRLLNEEDALVEVAHERSK